ncbi:MAG: alginate export family protein [Verrucomicrobia subdivision 3 bacterium]|nr:alginate export family protein [Limisphaerales bacterium]
MLLLAICLPAQGEERSAFQTLRYNEDWTFLRDASQRTDWLDPVKFVPLDGTNVYFSFGGEARLKYELYSEPVFNQQPADDNGFLLQRYLLHADLRATPHFRAFGQLQSSLEDFRNGGPRPTDRDDLDLHQAFFDARLPLVDDDSLTLRGGRQEMAYGSQRLISVRESPNNRLAFDAVRVLAHVGEWQADAWVAQPVEIDTGIFDDQRISETTFGGGYVSGPVQFVPGLRADFYYLGISRENATYARGTADEVRHSLGTRLFGKHGALDWNFEFVGQFGTFGNADILAWTAASDTGWTFADLKTKPRFFLRADIASGDHGGSDLGTFNPLFPRGAYFNEAALIGPQNLMDLQPGVDFALTKTLKLTTSCDFVWRESLDDGVYGVALNLQVPPGASRERYVGTFPSVTLSWRAQRHLSFTVNYVAYVFGDFVTQSQPTQSNGNYVSAIATFRF